MGATISHVAVTKLYTHNILDSDGKILPAVYKISTRHASVISHKPLTLNDRCEEKLLKGTNCKVLLSCTVIWRYDPIMTQV